MQGQEPIKGSLVVTADFYRSNLGHADCDNLNKAVSDAMNGIVYFDDNQVVDLHLKKFIDKNHPCVVVTVSDLDEMESDY